jgi:DNA-binding beta-propeller fold protein YncE
MANLLQAGGSKGSGPGQFNENHGIDIDSSGNIYVVDTRNYRIQKFSPDGTFIRQWGSTGCGQDQFLIAHDLKIDSSDNVYISDSGNVHFKSKVKCQ